MKMKRNISIVLVALMLITVLLGCQQPAPTPTVTPTTEPTSTPTTEPTTVPTEETTEPTTGPVTEPSEETTGPTEETTAPTETVHEHDFKAGQTVNPTCTDGGYTVYECECGESHNGDETSKRGHNYEADHNVEPTCDKRGYTVYKCSRCGDTYEDDYTTAKGHDYTSKVVAPTTEAQGYTEYTCEVCGYSYRDNYTAKLPEPTTEPTAQPTEHTHGYWVSETVNASCTEGGYKVYTCSCGDSYKGDKTDALGHNYSSKVVEPTTEAEGYTQYTCSRCGDSYKDNFTEKLPEPTTEPTTPAYYVPDRTCNGCDAWISGEVVTENGALVMQYHCPYCGHRNNFDYTEGHVCSFSATVFPADCLTVGYTWNECSCGNYYITDRADILGHDFSSGNTCSRCGYSEESTVTLDYAAAIAYGNQYAADTYGWTIDLSLNADNAGYNFPTSASVDTVIERGGQAYLHKIVEGHVDHLYETLSNRGDDWVYASINCDVYEYRDGGILVYVYYG